MPSDLNGTAVTIGSGVITLNVRHAQDIDADTFEGDWDWATATIHVRSLTKEAPTTRQVLCDTIIATPEATVSLGDADGMLVIPAPSTRTRLIVSAHDVEPTGMQTVWVDLVAAQD